MRRSEPNWSGGWLRYRKEGMCGVELACIEVQSSKPVHRGEWEERDIGQLSCKPQNAVHQLHTFRQVMQTNANYPSAFHI